MAAPRLGGTSEGITVRSERRFSRSEPWAGAEAESPDSLHSPCLPWSEPVLTDSRVADRWRSAGQVADASSVSPPIRYRARLRGWRDPAVPTVAAGTAVGRHPRSAWSPRGARESCELAPVTAPARRRVSRSRARAPARRRSARRAVAGRSARAPCRGSASTPVTTRKTPTVEQSTRCQSGTGQPSRS